MLEPFFNKRDQKYQERNLNKGHLDYTALAKLMASGFKDVEFESPGPDYRFTGTFPTLIEKPGDHGDLRRLDYVFLGEDLLPSVVTASIIANDTTQYLSDHLSLIIDLKIEW